MKISEKIFAKSYLYVSAHITLGVAHYTRGRWDMFCEMVLTVKRTNHPVTQVANWNTQIAIIFITKHQSFLWGNSENETTELSEFGSSLFVISGISCLFIPTLSKTAVFVWFGFHEIRPNRLYIHFSITPILLSNNLSIFRFLRHILEYWKLLFWLFSFSTNCLSLY